MFEFIDLTTISIALMIIGAIGVVLLKKPLDKVIMVSVLEAGLFLAIVSFRYLDVAFITAVLDPLSIIVFLLACLLFSFFFFFLTFCWLFHSFS